MPTFEYKAKKQNAETVGGKVIAEDRDDAVEKINQLGLTPVSVQDTNPAARAGGSLTTGGVKSKQLYLFSRQLGNLLKAGIPILRALEIIGEQIKDANFKNVIQSIHYGIQGGRHFSDCLADYPRIFSQLYVTMVKAGEESGNIRESLTSISQYLKTQDEITSKVKSALAYPILMGVLGIGTVFFILTYVMPQIAGLFDNLNQILPGPTIFVMKTSTFLINWGVYFLIGLVIGAVALKGWMQTSSGRVVTSRFLTGLPLIGVFWLKIELARFCRTLELLIKSGTTIVKAIQLSIPVVKNELLRKELSRCQEELVEGRSFGQGLKGSAIVPDIMGNLISVGEESGSLEGTLSDIAETYEQDTNELIKVMTTLLEPLMIVVVGGLVGFIVVAMLLPIFQLDVFAR